MQAWYKTGIGKYARELIKLGMTDEAVLCAVLAEYREAGTELSSIRWYRSKMRCTDKTILTNTEAKQAQRSSVSREDWRNSEDEGAVPDPRQPHGPRLEKPQHELPAVDRPTALPEAGEQDGSVGDEAGRVDAFVKEGFHR